MGTMSTVQTREEEIPGDNYDSQFLHISHSLVYQWMSFLIRGMISLSQTLLKLFLKRYKISSRCPLTMLVVQWEYMWSISGWCTSISALCFCSKVISWEEALLHVSHDASLHLQPIFVENMKVGSENWPPPMRREVKRSEVEHMYTMPRKNINTLSIYSHGFQVKLNLTYRIVVW